VKVAVRIPDQHHRRAGAAVGDGEVGALVAVEVGDGATSETCADGHTGSGGDRRPSAVTRCRNSPSSPMTSRSRALVAVGIGGDHPLRPARASPGAAGLEGAIAVPAQEAHSTPLV
jgi:hypothetical protein